MDRVWEFSQTPNFFQETIENLRYGRFFCPGSSFIPPVAPLVTRGLPISSIWLATGVLGTALAFYRDHRHPSSKPLLSCPRSSLTNRPLPGDLTQSFLTHGVISIEDEERQNRRDVAADHMV